eukprot:249062_1
MHMRNACSSCKQKDLQLKHCNKGSRESGWGMITKKDYMNLRFNKRLPISMRRKITWKKFQEIRKNQPNASGPSIISIALIYVLNYLKPTTGLFIKYAPLSFAKSLFCKAVPVSLYGYGPNHPLPLRIRCSKLLGYLCPILFSFYAYQQMLNDCDFHGIVVVKPQTDDTFKHVIPNCKDGEPMDLKKNTAVTIVYLKNKKQIDLFFDAIKNISAKRGCQSRYNEQYCNLCVLFPGFGSVQLKLQYPSYVVDIETEAKLFEKSLHKSKLYRCDALNIYLYEQYVFALDIFGSAKRKQCRQCSARNGKFIKLKVCSQCQMVFYCSRKCQKISWNNMHRNKCLIRF